MLCLSGFELYSRWVPLNTRAQDMRQTLKNTKLIGLLNLSPMTGFLSKMKASVSSQQI